MTDFTLAENSRLRRAVDLLVDLLFSASVKNNHYDGIKVRQNTFQSTKSNIDLVDKNNTAQNPYIHCTVCWDEFHSSSHCRDHWHLGEQTTVNLSENELLCFPEAEAYTLYQSANGSVLPQHSSVSTVWSESHIEQLHQRVVMNSLQVSRSIRISPPVQYFSIIVRRLQAALAAVHLDLLITAMY